MTVTPRVPCGRCGKATRVDAISYLRTTWLCPRCVRRLTPDQLANETRTPPDAA